MHHMHVHVLQKITSISSQEYCHVYCSIPRRDSEEHIFLSFLLWIALDCCLNYIDWAIFITISITLFYSCLCQKPQPTVVKHSERLRHFYTNCRRNADLMWGNSRTIFTFGFTSSKEVYLIFCFVQWAVCNRINEWYDELTYLLNNWWNIGMTNSLTECSTISSRGTKASKANSSNFPSFLTCQSQFRSLRYETQLWFPSINWWKVSLRYLATYHLRISSE